MMKLNPLHLRAFHWVTVYGGFTKAAESINTSQSTLSEQVHALEQRLGTQLLKRGQRTIELTEMGKILFTHTQRITDEERAIAKIFSSTRPYIEGILRIGADAPYHVMPIVAEYRKSFPAVDVRLSFGNATTLVQALRNLDVDIIFAPNINERGSFLSWELPTDKLFVVVAKTHVWAVKQSIQIEELSNETVILREKGSATRAILDRALAESKIKLNRPLEIGSREAIREAVAAGLGVSLLPENERGKDNRFAYLEVHNAALTNHEYIATLKTSRQFEPLSSFCDFLDSTNPPD